MSEIIIECLGLTHGYQRGKEFLPILKELDLAIHQGEFVALMGPSGSGKTTLLNLIGGLDQPTGGSIRIQGLDINNLSSKSLAEWRACNIGYIFQFYNLIPVLSAKANIELPLLLTQLSRTERKAHTDLALEIVGLTDRANHKPYELSGGQQQRVAIARAIVADAPILICDEPTGDLDRSTADEVLSLLQELNQQHGKTILMVTHDPRAAECAKSVMHMDKGTLSKSAAVSS